MEYPSRVAAWARGSPPAPPRSDDGLDNDGDGFWDMPTSTCTDGSTPGDPDWDASWDASEVSCGLGFELALLLPPLMWLRGRRRRLA